MSQQVDKPVGAPLSAYCDHCSSTVPLRFIEEFLPFGEFCSKECYKQHTKDAREAGDELANEEIKKAKQKKRTGEISEMQHAFALQTELLSDKLKENKALRKTIKSKDKVITKMSSDLIGIGLAMSQLEDRIVEENTSLKTQLLEANTKLQTQLTLLFLKLDKPVERDPTEWESADEEVPIPVQGVKKLKQNLKRLSKSGSMKKQ